MPDPRAAPTSLWNRNFLIWWLGSAQSALGSALAGIATSFLVLHQTGSAGAMGVNLALSLLPALLSPLFGTLMDRLPVRLPLVVGNLLRAALQLGVGLAALRGHVPLEVLHAVAFLTGLVGAFYGPASMGVTPRLVPPSELQRAGGLMQGTSQTMNMVGLVGGGLFVAHFGSGAALVFDGATFLLFGLLLTLVRFPTGRAKAAAETFWQSFTGGLGYVRGSAMLVGLPLIALLINASFAPLEMLLPKRMIALEAGAAGYGLFWGLELAGIALGSFGIAWLGERVNPRRLSVLGLAGLGAVVVALSLAASPGPMYALAALMGLTSAMTNLSISVLFQKRVDPVYYGRVGSLLGMVGMAGQPLTLLLLAPVADRVPISLVFAVAGVVTLLGAVVWEAVLRREPASIPPPAVPA
ncbi:MFS transporter [Deinococcus apachensis]|uniref:MFS transporter n=1 Tax=Deinococcus apachensis TaxID=309886 RepID=UPI00035F04E8|nr:MFS transporter [Deinococcus apachensis]